MPPPSSPLAAKIQAAITVSSVALPASTVASRWTIPTRVSPSPPDARSSFRFEPAPPRTEDEPASRAPFSLQIDDTEQKLPLVGLAARTMIDVPFGDSTLRLSFDNPDIAVRPGSLGNSDHLLLQLPCGARLVRVRRLTRAFPTKDKWVDESGRRTPTSLGEAAGAWLPVLDGRETEEIEVEIAQILGATTSLLWPLATPGSLRVVHVEVRAKSADGPLLAESIFRERNPRRTTSSRRRSARRVRVCAAARAWQCGPRCAR